MSYVRHNKSYVRDNLCRTYDIISRTYEIINMHALDVECAAAGSHVC